METEYITPEILKDSDEEVIHKRMLDILPDSLDKLEGNHVWDLTRPTAIEMARLKGYEDDQIVQLIWPMFAAGIYLDYHAQARGMKRKQGVAAHGFLTITGEPETVINEGDLFSTVSINEQETVSYRAMQTHTIPEEGSIVIPIKCSETGMIGNASAGTILLTETPNDGIQLVTNEAAVTGGIEEEEDEALRERLLEHDRTGDVTYVGTLSDYKRWANEVSGVGEVNVIPAQDDSGVVTIVVTDGNGDPANEEICLNVYNHIMRPDNKMERPAPINSNVRVVPPTVTKVSVSASVEAEGTSIEQITASFLKSLKEYYKKAADDNEIRYTQVASLLSSTPGVYDFKELTLNGAKANIPVKLEAVPFTGPSMVRFSAGGGESCNIKRN